MVPASKRGQTCLDLGVHHYNTSIKFITSIKVTPAVCFTNDVSITINWIYLTDNRDKWYMTLTLKIPRKWRATTVLMLDDIVKLRKQRQDRTWLLVPAVNSMQPRSPLAHRLPVKLYSFVPLFVSLFPALRPCVSSSNTIKGKAIVAHISSQIQSSSLTITNTNRSMDLLSCRNRIGPKWKGPFLALHGCGSHPNRTNKSVFLL